MDAMSDSKNALAPLLQRVAVHLLLHMQNALQPGCQRRKSLVGHCSGELFNRPISDFCTGLAQRC